METTKLKPSQISEALAALVKMQQPVMLHSSPGMGKSQIVHQTADSLGMALTDVRAVLLDPVDLRGLPTVNGDGRAHWATPDFLPTEGAGILFLDEINAAPLAVQAACYQLILDRKLGEYVLPAGWAIVAAGNLQTDRAVVNRMSTALASRFTHIEMICDLDDWCRWALAAGIKTEVIAFLRFRPELLHNFDKDGRTFPCPRTWEFASKIIGGGLTNGIEFGLLAGTVGEGAAAELAGFLKIYRQLPSPDAVLMSPDTADMPDDPATLYALAGALARKASPDNFDRVIAYVGRMPAEFSVLTVRDAITRDAALQSTRPFIEWAAANSDVLI